MEETLYPRPETLFRYRVNGGGEISYQSRGDSVSGRLYFVTPAAPGRRRQFVGAAADF